jgi:hypothetical protein
VLRRTRTAELRVVGAWDHDPATCLCLEQHTFDVLVQVPSPRHAAHVGTTHAGRARRCCEPLRAGVPLLVMSRRLGHKLRAGDRGHREPRGRGTRPGCRGADGRPCPPPGGRPVTPAGYHLDSLGALLYDQHRFGIWCPHRRARQTSVEGMFANGLQSARWRTRSSRW